MYLLVEHTCDRVATAPREFIEFENGPMFSDNVFFYYRFPTVEILDGPCGRVCCIVVVAFREFLFGCLYL